MSNSEFPSEKDLKNQPEAKKPNKNKAEAKKANKPKEEHQEQELLAQIKQLQADKDALEDKYLRSEAEIQNAQNRYSKERAQLIKYESQSLAKDVLPAIDNLQRALSVKVEDEASKQLKKGVEMTLDALIKALADHGISEIKADGEKFDPNLHQAVQTTPAKDDAQKDHVVQVLQAGYQYKDRTLRPAMVVVAQ